MRNKKKNKGEGGAAASAAATTASPSGASNTSCYLQVRESRQREKGAERKEKNCFSLLERCIEKIKPPQSSIRARCRRKVTFGCIDLFASVSKTLISAHACILVDQNDSKWRLNPKNKLEQKKQKNQSGRRPRHGHGRLRPRCFALLRPTPTPLQLR